MRYQERRAYCRLENPYIQSQWQCRTSMMSTLPQIPGVPFPPGDPQPTPPGPVPPPVEPRPDPPMPTPPSPAPSPCLRSNRYRNRLKSSESTPQTSELAKDPQLRHRRPAG